MTPSLPVTVGFDGSSTATTAVEWAAAEAARRGERLRIITATHHPGMPSSAGSTSMPLMPRTLGTRADERSKQAREIAARRLPESDIDSAVVADRAAAALLEASSQASMVVVGHRGHGTLTSALLGSVSMAVAEHAQCPVVVVRGAVEEAEGRQVAVGVDGTSESEPALLFAAAAAAQRKVPLRVVCAWVMPQAAWADETWQTVPADDWVEMSDALSEAARVAADSAAARARATWPDLVVEAEAPIAAPALALEDISRVSGLVVVGARGVGTMREFFLGSVSRSVLHQSACPVAVVRAQ